MSPFPAWLKRPLPTKGEIATLKQSFRAAGLHTVCESASCPNIGDCFARRTATFMINGNICTRACRFCDVESGRPLPQNPREPEELAKAAKNLGLRYIVVTSVNRDDLEDGAARQFVLVAQALRNEIPGIQIEFLIPDFEGQRDALLMVLESQPDVLNHNLETVRRLTSGVRSKARYDRSLEVLRRASQLGATRVKTGVMLGLGETREELIELFADVRETGCGILTLGQYLRPSPKHIEVQRFVPPAEFAELKLSAERAGIATVFAGPWVRSSYHAGEVAHGLAV